MGRMPELQTNRWNTNNTDLEELDFLSDIYIQTWNAAVHWLTEADSSCTWVFLVNSVCFCPDERLSTISDTTAVCTNTRNSSTLGRRVSL